MRFKGFKIKNYRSIVDSGWNLLAYDNITALIGQNESGKTSVLEALMSFYDGKISDDVLRSDMTFPIVSCMFELDGNVNQLMDSSAVPEELRNILNNKKEIILERKWKPDRTTSVIAGDDDVVDYFHRIQ